MASSTPSMMFRSEADTVETDFALLGLYRLVDGHGSRASRANGSALHHQEQAGV